jgi:hypothetical protein
VHHLFYHYRVWEAPDHALVTLCHDTCHQKDGDYVWTQKSPVPGRPGVFQQTGKIGPYFDTLLLLAHEFRNRGISIRRLMAFARLIPQLTEGQWQDIVRYIPAEEETQSEDDAAFAEYMNSRGQA